jgi:thiosulfate reductase cytochrome b subunit
MQYLKIVPTQWSILPAAGSCIVQYSALQLPSEPGGFFRFDAIQQLSYFFIVFVTAPLAILTGLAMSPPWTTGSSGISGCSATARSPARCTS